MASARNFVTPRWLTVVAAILVAGIAFLAFAISFAALSDLAARSGIPREIAWAWPLIVDGSIVTAMLVIFAWRGQGRQQTTWPWITLAFFAIVSIVGNGVHTVAVLDVRQGVSVEFAILVGALPPIGLLLSSEMLVRLLAGRTPALEPDTMTREPEPEPEPRQPLPADDTTPAPVTRPTTSTPAGSPATQPVAPHREPAFVATAASAVVSQADDPPAGRSDSGMTRLNDDVTGPGDTSVTAQVLTGDKGHDTTPESPAIGATEGELKAEGAVRDDIADDTVGTADDGTTTSEDTSTTSAPRLRAIESVPDEPASQVEWIVTRARAGRDTSKETLADLLAEAGHDVSMRTVQRRLAEARKREPVAFDESATEPSRTVVTR
ncbi:DUF2637 domain-containing protein [Gulosibacter sediminis]|uniref:DUF2637 domain-containing protein n=1 Tax=Gulosibacter sediminis TaxID=1729695 RepID=UPI0024A88595|nr:DUF2637 domain-containing protein [Gulosibacter sediminis]